LANGDLQAELAQLKPGEDIEELASLLKKVIREVRRKRLPEVKIIGRGNDPVSEVEMVKGKVASELKMISPIQAFNVSPPDVDLSKR
jgi:hypothetical protein